MSRFCKVGHGCGKTIRRFCPCRCHKLNGLLFFALAAVAVSIVGCREAPPAAPSQPSSQMLLRRADRSEALLGAAAAQLADLPSAVDTQLRPPVVILDASKSANGEDVYAVAVRNPNVPDSPINVVNVPAGNSRFRSLGVQSGDIVKFFIVPDETVDEERRAAGLTRYLAQEYTVAQVIDDNTLLLDRGVPPAIVKSYLAEFRLDVALPMESLAMGMVIPARIEIWRNRDDRLREIDEKLRTYETYRYPPVGWQPSADDQALRQIVAWLNQWLRQSEPKTDWRPDALLETLDHQLTTQQLALFLSAESLTANFFDPYDDLQPEQERTMRDALYDGRLLQEAVWLRDISRWAPADNFSDVARVRALFDWTVRNVQLEADEDRKPHRPWQVLLFGRGTAEQRAWVFALLCRQQGIEVVMLNAAAEGKGDYWLAAAVIDQQLYLFDPRLGLPIPGAGGEGVATLHQVQQDDALLRQLDLEDAAYPLTAASLQNISPHVVADPFDLSRRALQLESKLTGHDQLVLASRPSELAQRLKEVSGLAAARLWETPFRTLHDQWTLGPVARRREEVQAFKPFAVRPVLWKARTRHFQGRRRPTTRSTDEIIDDHREAAQLYSSKQVRPTDRDIARSPTAEERRVQSVAKLHATYWLGLLSFDDGKYEVAEHWLSRPELTAKGSPWASGARYNLARTYEAQGKLDEAIELLQPDTSPQSHGNRVRARWLKARAAATPSE